MPQWIGDRALVAAYRRELDVDVDYFDNLPRDQWTAETTVQLEAASEKADRLSREYGDSSLFMFTTLVFLVEFMSPAFMWFIAGKFL